MYKRQVLHASFGVGEITHTFGSGEKVSIAVKFAGMGPKILDPRLAQSSLLVEAIDRKRSIPCRCVMIELPIEAPRIGSAGCAAIVSV